MSFALLVMLAFASFIVGFSGAIVPGPLFVAVVSQAPKKGFLVGPFAVLGHSILEILTIIIFWIGLGILLTSELIRFLIGLFGGTFLILMGCELARFAHKASIQKSLEKAKSTIIRHNPILIGLVTSAINPYFYLWWATVGNEFMFRGLDIAGILGVTVFLASHWISDLVWYTFISGSIHKGKQFITDSIYQRMLLVCSIILAGIGVAFLADAVHSRILSV